MSLPKIEKISDTAVYVPGNDIDTDRIIPARFMKCVTFDGLGQYAFYDVRFDTENKPLNHPLDQYPDAPILISGENFGCGSSREHAPQALYYWGIRCVIAQSFAEIFFGNCITLGIPCLATPHAQEIGEIINQNPSAKITVDLQNSTISLLDKEFSCTIPEESRLALVNGEWDPISLLLDNKDPISKVHSSLPLPKKSA